MKSEPKKKNRLMAFLSSLCASKPDNDRCETKDKRKSKLKVHKVPRLTFQLDRVLVKLSRKNVVEEQFMENQVLTYHLEKYLANRFKDCDIVIFSGEFSNFLMQKIPYSIELKPTKQQAFQSQNNYILANRQSNTNFRFQAIDAMVFQLYFGDCEEDSKKSENSEKTQQTKEQSEVNSEIDRIQVILKFYQKRVNSFVFICHKNLKIEDIHGLFLVFREKYMFEFQRVRKIQKTACNIIYVSTRAKFLRMDDMSLCDFIITELQKMKGFQQEKEHKKTEQTLKYEGIIMKNRKSQKTIRQNSKKQVLKILPEEEMLTLKYLSARQSFQTLLLKMFERNLHLEVSQALSIIMQFSQKRSNKINWFLELMHQRYPDSREIVDSYRLKPEEREEDITKTFSELTPLFAQKSNTNNFSKMTALFKAHSIRDEDEFMVCQQEDHDEMEF